MIPIRDDAPRTTTPYVNYFLVAANVLVFFFELSLAPANRTGFFYQFALVPSHFTGFLHGSPQFGAVDGILPIFSAMFLHGGWAHLIFNMWALWIFGDNVEDFLGHTKYLLFYLVSGIGASLLHIAFNLGSNVPSLGASGAIAGVMGAYFLLYPSARVLTLVPFFFLYLTWLPAWLFIGFWFIVQFLSGAATALPHSGQAAGGVAFWAHVGGFLTGVALIKLLPARPRRYRFNNWEA